MLSNIDRKLVQKGKRHEVWAIVRSGRCLFEDYLQDCQESDKKKITKAIQRFCDNGPSPLPTKFKKLENTDGLCELKPTNQVRLFGFFPAGYALPLPRVFVITHGVTKKRQRHHEEDVERGKSLRHQYLEEFGKGG